MSRVGDLPHVLLIKLILNVGEECPIFDPSFHHSPTVVPFPAAANFEAYVDLPFTDHLTSLDLSLNTVNDPNIGAINLDLREFENLDLDWDPDITEDATVLNPVRNLAQLSETLAL